MVKRGEVYVKGSNGNRYCSPRVFLAEDQMECSGLDPMADAQGVQGDIVKHIWRNPGSTYKQIADSLGMTASSVRSSVGTLKAKGVVRTKGHSRRGPGAEVSCYIANSDTRGVTSTKGTDMSNTTILDSIAAVSSAARALLSERDSLKTDIATEKEARAKTERAGQRMHEENRNLQASLKEAEVEGRRWREAFHAETLRREDAEKEIERQRALNEATTEDRDNIRRELEALKAKQAQLGALLSGFINP